MYLGLHLWVATSTPYRLRSPELRRILRYLATVAIALGRSSEDIPTEELLRMELPLTTQVI